VNVLIVDGGNSQYNCHGIFPLDREGGYYGTNHCDGKTKTWRSCSLSSDSWKHKHYSDGASQRAITMTFSMKKGWSIDSRKFEDLDPI
jgi:hypothetical protein